MSLKGSWKPSGVSTADPTPIDAASRGGRILELDILRGVAILLVLAIHSPGASGRSGIFRPLDVVMHQFGWSGVDLFFVLSGFLIGGLLFNEIQKHGQVNVGRFLVRRMLRIWPAFYVLVAVAFIRLSIDSNGDFQNAFSEMWPALVHIQNYVGVPREQLWSLAIEEHFYLILPLFLALLLRGEISGDRLRMIPRLSVGLVVGCLALRTALVLTTTLNVRSQTYLCIDALFLGVALAYVRVNRPGLLDRVAAMPGLLAVSCLLFVPAFFAGTIRETIGYTGLLLGYALVLIRFMYPRYRGPLLNRWISSRSAKLVAWIGTYSYSIYLFHFDTGWWGYLYTERAAVRLGLPDEVVWLLHTTAWFVVSIVGGMLIARIIEVPVLRLRDRLFPPAVAAELSLGQRETIPRRRQFVPSRRATEAAVVDLDPA